MSFNKIKEPIMEKFGSMNPEHLRMLVVCAIAGIGTAGYYGNQYYQKIQQPVVVTAAEIEKPFPTENWHYVDHKSPSQSLKADVSIVISLTSKASLSAYEAYQDFTKRNGLSLEIIHAGMNENWETPSRTFYTLQLIKPDVDLTPFFRFFGSTKGSPEGNPTNALRKILIENKIDASLFDRTFESIDIIEKVNNANEKCRSLNIEAVPTTFAKKGQFTIPSGTYTSFQDSTRIIPFLLKP